MVLKETKQNYLTAMVLGISFALGYSWAAARLLTGYADSDDLLLAAYNLGLAHPPGYPLLVILLHPFLIWTAGAGVVVRAQWFNSGMSALNVVLVYIFTLGWLEKVWPERINRRIIGIATACLFGLSEMIFRHAAVLEVFPLAQTILLLFFISTLKGRIGLMGLLGTLAGWYHPLAWILVLPIWSIYSWRLIKRRQLQKIISFIAGAVLATMMTISMYVYLARQSAVYSWPIQANLNSIVATYFRQIYSSGGSAIESLSKNFDLKLVWQSLVQSFILGWSDVNPVGVLLGLAGWIILFRRNKQLGIITGVLWFISGTALVIYLKYPLKEISSDTEYFWGTTLRYRMMFANMLTLIWFWPIGLAGLGKLFNRRVVLIGMSIVIGFYGWLRMTQMNEAKGNFTDVLTAGILETLPAQASLYVDSDLAFTLLAQQQINGLRPDVIIRPVRIPVVRDQGTDITNIPAAHQQDYPWLVTRQMQKDFTNNRRVFTFLLGSDVIEFLGGEGNPWFVRPFQYALEISPRMRPVTSGQDYGLTVQLANQSKNPADWWINGLRGLMAENHTTLAYYFARMGYRDVAETNRQLALKLSELPKTRYIINQTINEGEHRFETENDYGSYVVPTTSEYLKKGDNALINQNWDQAYYYYSRAFIQSPDDNQVQQKLSLLNSRKIIER
jgi:hypothetical protein